MEPLAHTLVGATLAETGLAYRHGRRLAGATLTGVVAANLPDVDVLAYLWGGDAALDLRRGWTHGVLVVPLLPLAWIALLALWGRIRGASSSLEPRALLPLAAVAVLSHPFLDWLNVYGIRLLMPFDQRWFYGDAVFIVDPWLWLVLGGALFLVRHRRARRPGRSLLLWLSLAVVTSVAVVAALPVVAPDALAPALVLWLGGISAVALIRWRTSLPGDPRQRRRTAWLALTVVSIYVATMVASTAVARERVRSSLAEREVGALRTPQRLMVGAEPFDPFRRRVVASVPERLWVGEYRFGDDPALGPGRTIETGADSTAARRALEAPEIRGFANWVRFPWFEVVEEDGERRVVVRDARYVDPGEKGFGAASVPLSETDR